MQSILALTVHVDNSLLVTVIMTMKKVMIMITRQLW